MNPKPYGWHCFIGKGKEEQDFLFINGKGSSMPDASWDKVISLYTHPVKEQEVKAKYGITTKWDEITTYHETIESIGKTQK